MSFLYLYDKTKKDYDIRDIVILVKIKIASRFLSNSEQDFNIEITVIIFNKIFRVPLIR